MSRHCAEKTQYGEVCGGLFSADPENPLGERCLLYKNHQISTNVGSDDEQPVSQESVHRGHSIYSLITALVVVIVSLALLASLFISTKRSEPVLIPVQHKKILAPITVKQKVVSALVGGTTAGVTVSPCGDVYVCDFTGYVKVLSARSRNLVAKIMVPGSPFACVVSSNEKAYVLSNKPDRMYVVDKKKGEVSALVLKGNLTALTITESGKVCTAAGSTLYIVDTLRGDTVSQIHVGRGSVTALASDGASNVYASMGKSLYRIDTDSGQVAMLPVKGSGLQALSVLNGTVYALDMSSTVEDTTKYSLVSIDKNNRQNTSYIGEVQSGKEGPNYTICATESGKVYVTDTSALWIVRNGKAVARNVGSVYGSCLYGSELYLATFNKYVDIVDTTKN